MNCVPTFQFFRKLRKKEEFSDPNDQKLRDFLAKHKRVRPALHHSAADITIQRGARFLLTNIKSNVAHYISTRGYHGYFKIEFVLVVYAYSELQLQVLIEITYDKFRLMGLNC